MFPLINNLSEVREFFESRPNFSVRTLPKRDDIILINYIIDDGTTFVGQSDEETALLREGRGLMFDAKTGALIRRPLHKFFNVNQNPLSMMDKIDWTDPLMTVMQKLDGSMIAPFRDPQTNMVRFGTKAGFSEVAMSAEVFAAKNPKYIKFSEEMLNINIQPIFEFMHPNHRIVVDHKEPKMVLIALRNMTSGAYLQAYMHHMHHDIPKVQTFDVLQTPKQILSAIENMQDDEGFVISFSNGERVKLKCDWYLRLHKTKDALSHEHDLANLVLHDQIDDLLPLLPEFDKARVNQYAQNFNAGLKDMLADTMKSLHHVAVMAMDRKTFALNSSQIGIKDYQRNLVFKFVYDLENKYAAEDVLDEIKRQVSLAVSKKNRYIEFKQKQREFANLKFNVFETAE